MNSYETLFIIRPTLTEEETKAQIKRVEDIIAQNGGEIRLFDDMGMRKLAYPIDKQARGYYGVIYYNGPSELISELEYRLRYNEDILRFMTVKYTSKKELAKFDEVVSKNKTEEATPAKEEASEQE